MSVQGWKYYNHAAIPTSAPHEEPNLIAIQDGTIWHMEGKPLLARWVTDWDCDQDTGWWYIICDSPYVFDNLSKSSRKNIRNALKNCEVKRISPVECADDLWRVFQEATSRYSKYEMTTSEKCFKDQLKKNQSQCEYWGGYERVSGRLIGYKMCTVYDEWVEFSVSKYAADYLKLRVSDALNTIVLDNYLNKQRKKYVSNGSRSIVHETNVQDYYQEHFNFRKAYCRLHITYNQPFGVFVNILYPFRKLIKTDSILGNKISAILYMEEIKRNMKKS